MPYKSLVQNWALLVSRVGLNNKYIGPDIKYRFVCKNVIKNNNIGYTAHDGNTPLNGVEFVDIMHMLRVFHVAYSWYTVVTIHTLVLRPTSGRNNQHQNSVIFKIAS